LTEICLLEIKPSFSIGAVSHSSKSIGGIRRRHPTKLFPCTRKVPLHISKPS